MFTFFNDQVQFEYLMNKNGKFQSVFKSVPIDWCSIMTGKLKSYFFVKMTLNGFKLAAPQFFHTCPYGGIHAAKDMKPRRVFVSMYPSGNFKVKIKISNGTHKAVQILYEYETF